MSETPGEYIAVDTGEGEEAAVPVACPTCHTVIGHIVTYNDLRWLAVGGVLQPYLPASSLCLECKSPVYFGEPHRQRVKRAAGELWDGKKFVKVEG